MTFAEALLKLAAIQMWMRAADAQGERYGPGYFVTDLCVRTVEHANRKVSIRMIRLAGCAGCSGPLSEAGTCDHLIPVSRGGPEDATNYFNLCARCNTCKGTRDLIDWWRREGRTLEALGADAICSYARLMWQYLGAEGRAREAPLFLQFAIRDFCKTLPERHAEAFRAVGAAPVVRERAA